VPEVVVFFKSYLVDQFTRYTWDNDLSPEFPSSIRVGQGSALSPILLALCFAPLLKEFECRVCVAVLISYVDNGTIIVQSDTWDKNLVKLRSAYKIIFKLTQFMGLVLKHNKLEGFHFSQKHSDSNPDINLGYTPYTGDEHGRAVHHGNVHSTHSRLTQNNAFRRLADALRRRSLILPKLYCRSVLLH
jgi:hypothetical protein